eukprot:scaffold83732_cov69-Phaeocystis_antarctica.AAC.2
MSAKCRVTCAAVPRNVCRATCAAQRVPRNVCRATCAARAGARAKELDLPLLRLELALEVVELGRHRALLRRGGLGDLRVVELLRRLARAVLRLLLGREREQRRGDRGVQHGGRVRRRRGRIGAEALELARHDDEGLLERGDDAVTRGVLRLVEECLHAKVAGGARVEVEQRAVHDERQTRPHLEGALDVRPYCGLAPGAHAVGEPRGLARRRRHSAAEKLDNRIEVDQAHHDALGDHGNLVEHGEREAPARRAAHCHLGGCTDGRHAAGPEGGHAYWQRTLGVIGARARRDGDHSGAATLAAAEGRETARLAIERRAACER